MHNSDPSQRNDTGGRSGKPEESLLTPREERFWKEKSGILAVVLLDYLGSIAFLREFTVFEQNDDKAFGFMYGNAVGMSCLLLYALWKRLTK